MSGPDSDNELEDFLARRSSLRGLSDGDFHEPPADLDRIVLARAREAIRRPSETPVYRSPQWAMPVGLAASLLLVFAVVLNFTRTSPSAVSAPAVASSEPQAQSTNAASEQALVAQADEFSKTLADAKAEADRTASPAKDQLVAKRDATFAAAPRAELEAKSRSSSNVLTGEASSPALARQRAPAGSAKESRSAVAQAANAPLDQRAANASGGFIGADSALSSKISASVSASDAPPAAATAMSPAPPPSEAGAATDSSAASSSPLLASTAAVVTREQPRSDSLEEVTTTSAEPSRVAGSFDDVSATAARRVRGKRTTASPTPAAVAAERAKHSDPDQWLREIDALRAGGRVAEANRELEAFHRAYPEHSTHTQPAEPAPQ